MNRALATLTQDWRRKLVALVIAFALWTWIEGRIAIERAIILTVASTSEGIGTPKDNELLIQSPPGWVLTDPMVGSPIKIWLNGSKSELQSFATRQCAASSVVAFSAPEDQVSIQVPIAPEDLDWLRPQDAELLLKNVPEDAHELTSLTFQRIKSETIQLTSRAIEVQGNPSEAWLVLKDELAFEPNTITVTGPQRAMTRLLNKIEAAQNNPTATPSGLLNIFEIPEGTRSRVARMQTLNLDWQRQGIRMDPPQVRVVAEIRLANPISIPLNRKFEDLHIIPPANPAVWQKGSWEAQPWVVEMPDVEDNQEIIDEAWVNAHVLLVLPLNSLNATIETEPKVRIEAHIVGLESAQVQQFYEKYLVIRPLVPGNDFIPYSRVQ